MLKINVLYGNEIDKNIYFNHWSILLEFKKFFYESGIIFNFYNLITKNITDCDFLFLSSKFFSIENNLISNKSIEIIYNLKKKNKNIIWFDLRDSAGTTQFEIIDLVKAYVKKQFYKNKDLYKKKMYGGRDYTDFYFNKFNIKDNTDYNYSLIDNKNLQKLKLGWNLGTYRFDYYQTNFINKKIKKIYNYLGLPNTNFKYENFKFNKNFRVIALHNLSFDRNTISFQRKLVNEILSNVNNKKDIFGKKISRSSYNKIFKNSSIAISCFGWGEICYRDWESSIASLPIIKPDMSNIETWPNLYVPDYSYIPTSWDFKNLNHVIEDLENDTEKQRYLTFNAQNIHKKIRSEEGINNFIKIIKNIIKN